MAEEENDEEIAGGMFVLALLIGSLIVFIAGLTMNQPIASAIIVAIWVYFLRYR